MLQRNIKHTKEQEQPWWTHFLSAYKCELCDESLFHITLFSNQNLISNNLSSFFFFLVTKVLICSVFFIKLRINPKKNCIGWCSKLSFTPFLTRCTIDMWHNLLFNYCNLLFLVFLCKKRYFKFRWFIFLFLGAFNVF